MTPYQQIKALLPQLSNDELQRLKKEIGASLQFASGVSNGNRHPELEKDEVVSVVHDVCKAFAISGHYQQLVTESKRPNNAEKIFGLKTWLARVTSTKATRLTILRMGIELLHADLSGWMDQPVTGGILVRHIDKIPSVLDKHFPGYARSGLLNMIVQGEVAV